MIELKQENKEQISEYLLEMFKEYKPTLRKGGYEYININFNGKYKMFEINIPITYRMFVLSKNYKSYEYLYSSPKYNSDEQLYDELIIFKELLLPKYLNENQ